MYGLFGKLIKGLPHKEAVNKKLKKGLEIEIKFDLNDHNYHIIRNKRLELWEDGVKISPDGKTESQKLIEDTIKLNYESFINIVLWII